MLTGTTLLRVLLSIFLILNGAGAAAASVHMAAAGMQMHQGNGHAKSLAADTAVPCHEQVQPAATGHDATSGMSSDGSSPAMPDCCKFGTCQCICVSHAQAGFVVTLPGNLPSAAAIAPYPRADARPAPVPDELLRPPIA